MLSLLNQNIHDVWFCITCARSFCSCVKGVLPKVGDRVLVEATYNANMPFKWNATRIQVLPNQVSPDIGNLYMLR